MLVMGKMAPMSVLILLSEILPFAILPVGENMYVLYCAVHTCVIHVCTY